MADSTFILPSLALPLANAVRDAVRDLYGLTEVQDAVSVSSSPKFGHFQTNVALRHAKALGTTPPLMAQAIADRIDPTYAVATVVGGFVNFTLTDQTLSAALSAFSTAPLADSGQTVVIDYSSPNVAKAMHVGHLRSTVIGDALARVLAHRGHNVIPQNHIGDWGTQFGMLIELYLESTVFLALHDLDQLTTFYRAARERFDADEDFARRARGRVVKLQAGDTETLEIWRSFVRVSEEAFLKTYSLMGVKLNADHFVGESYYNDKLPSLVSELLAADLLQTSDGALCFFSPAFVNRDKEPLPLIVRKSDGGYGYAATDVAALQHRVENLNADRIVYVVDSRQALHFQQVFALASKAGILPSTVAAEHVGFGTVLGEDNRPFKTRSGETVSLELLLQEAVEAASAILVEKNGHADPDRAVSIGVGAVKYADLAAQRHRDYVFSLDRLLSFDGNTGPYLQYAHARLSRVLKKAGTLEPGVLELAEPAELSLAYSLLKFESVVQTVETTLEPHHLCTYLYEVASKVSAFYEACPVLKAEGTVRTSRLMLVSSAKAVIGQGLDLLGIDALEAM